MAEKSHVSMQQQVCYVCGLAFDTGSLLLDRRLKQSMERNTTTGWGLCPEHEERYNEGYVALVGCDEKKSQVFSGQKELAPETAYRTGNVIHIRRHIFPQVFNLEIDDKTPMVFVGDDVITQLKEQWANAGLDLPEG